LNFHELATLVSDIHTNYFKISDDFSEAIPIISSNICLLTYHSYIENAVKFKKIEEVHVYSLDYRKKHILGRFQKYEKNAEVWIDASLNTCWKRYVIAKELSHLIVDTKSTSFTTDINKIVLWMIKDGMPADVNDALDSEHIAAQFAAELLLPYHSTQHLLKNNSITDIDIASKFKVPLRIVQVMRFKTDYLSKRDKAYN